MIKAFLFFLLCIVACCGLMIGSVKLDIFNLSDIEKDILFHVRAPRVLLAALVGASLALSGALFQYVMKNPLADSFTTGVSASSAMGAVVAIMLGFGVLIPFFALLGGLAGLAMVYKIASVHGKVQPITMLLAGIAMNVFCSATISFMKFLSDDAVSSIVFWLMGGFQSASVNKVAILFITLLVTFFFIKQDYLSLDIICFDDTTALSSGVNVPALRKENFFYCFSFNSFLCGLCRYYRVCGTYCSPYCTAH